MCKNVFEMMHDACQWSAKKSFEKLSQLKTVHVNGLMIWIYVHMA